MDTGGVKALRLVALLALATALVAGGGGAVTVNFNVTSPNARSFTQSEAELSAMLLRAVKRGTRAS